MLILKLISTILAIVQTVLLGYLLFTTIYSKEEKPLKHYFLLICFTILYAVNVIILFL